MNHLDPSLPFADYLAVEAMSASGAKKMLRSPQHYLLERTRASEPTPAMQFGTAVHAGVLEPATFAEAVACAPEIDKRSKAGRAEHEEFAAAHAGAIILQPEAYARALACIQAVRSHPAAAKLLDGAECEASLFWEDRQFKCACKARFDAMNLGGVIDLKTCQDASAEAFGRQAASFLYHVQAAHYVSAAEHVLDRSPAFFAFVCVESEPPHAVAVYALDAAAILAGRHLMDIALERYAAALAAGEWPGYPETIERLQLPQWALRFPA